MYSMDLGMTLYLVLKCIGLPSKFPRPYGRGILCDGQARPTSSDTSIHGVTPVVLRRNNKYKLSDISDIHKLKTL